MALVRTETVGERCTDLPVRLYVTGTVREFFANEDLRKCATFNYVQCFVEYKTTNWLWCVVRTATLHSKQHGA
jgi:hypothetical protein